jgi:FkbM family methyltransferase
MYLIHQPIINKTLKHLVSPFRKLIPQKYHFAIEGDVAVSIENKESFLITGNITSPITQTLFWGGIHAFENEEFPFFTKLISSCNLMLDIGSNIGYYTLLAKRFQPNIKIIAFEPMPSVFNYLNKNIQINNFKNVFTEQLALSNVNGNASFYTRINPRMKSIADQLPGDSSLDSSIVQSAIEVQVKLETLDNYVKQHLNESENIDFIKIDTEATEHLVFQGAENVLTNHRPIIMCEVIKNKNQHDLEAIFSKHDYNYMRISNKELVLFEHIVIEKPKEDYFFVPKEKMHLLHSIK